MAPDNLPDFFDVRSGSSTKPADAAAVEAPRTYAVKKGDSLSKIAKKVYGHANQWTRIFEANRDIITNPDLIKPGQVASVATENTAPGSKLTAVWIHESGQTVDSTVQPLASGAPSITEFHIMKPSGWPDGAYKVVILLDGKPAGEKQFVVK